MDTDRAEYKSAWYRKNRERILAQRKERYKADPERDKARHRKWFNNPIARAKRYEYLKKRRAKPVIREKLLKAEAVWRANHKRYIREMYLTTKYGITIAEYDALLASQGGGCKICGAVKRLHLDHCHTSRLNRGILCNRCNIGIGYFSDNPSLLKKAAAYLETP